MLQTIKKIAHKSTMVLIKELSALLMLTLLCVEADVSRHHLNGKNVAVATRVNHKCCDGVTRKVTTSVAATIFQKSNKRTNFGSSFNRQMKNLNSHRGDHKGHILASVFGGPAQLWNFAPQASNVNRKEKKKNSLLNTWYDCEKYALHHLKKRTNLPLQIKVSLTYSQGDCRPTLWSIDVKGSGKNPGPGCSARNIHNGLDPHFAACQRR